MSGPLVEVLTFEGCPHAEPALKLVKRVLADSGVGATVRRVDVPDADAAAAQRFLGSPTIRVNGRDIEPGVAAATSTCSPAGSTAPTPVSPASRTNSGYVRR